MKKVYTIKAKTVAEAYSQAIALYASDGDISYEVITEGKKGFLGFGRVPAEIKVTVDDGIEEKKAPRAQIQINNERKPKNNNQKKPQADAPKTEGAPKANNQPKNNNQQKNSNQPKNNGQKNNNQQKNNGQKNNNQPKNSAPKNNTPKAPKTPEAKEEAINVTVQEKTIAMEFLRAFIKDAGLECEVKGDLTLNENGFVSRLITIEGKDAPSLIGHRGDMLDALQYLANLCLARKSEGEHKEYVKVIIDIENYREKREMALRALARRMAEKAIKYQRNVPLEPMNPYERMIIHSEIQKIEGVSTHSVGYDDNRKIVITCDKKRSKPQQQ